MFIKYYEDRSVGKSASNFSKEKEWAAYKGSEIIMSLSFWKGSLNGRSQQNLITPIFLNRAFASLYYF